jgi:hypothetical protein
VEYMSCVHSKWREPGQFVKEVLAGRSGKSKTLVVLMRGVINTSSTLSPSSLLVSRDLGLPKQTFDMCQMDVDVSCDGEAAIRQYSARVLLDFNNPHKR